MNTWTFHLGPGDAVDAPLAGEDGVPGLCWCYLHSTLSICTLEITIDSDNSQHGAQSPGFVFRLLLDGLEPLSSQTTA